MRHRLYTAPQMIPEEGNILAAMLERGLPWLHLRKPGYELEEMETLIQSIPATYHPHLILHQHWELADRYAVGGVHWTEWMRRKQEPALFDRLVAKQQEMGWQVGTSIHHPLMLDQLPPFLDYATASPLFPSISKIGYRPSFDWYLHQSYPFPIVGLGGIDLHNLESAQERGFKEIAFLGAVWEEPERAVLKYQRLCNALQQLDPMP